MSDSDSPDSREVDFFNSYFDTVNNLRNVPNPGVLKAVKKALVHESWTDEALDPNNSDSWVVWVGRAKRAVDDPKLDALRKKNIRTALADLVVFGKFMKPISDPQNKLKLDALKLATKGQDLRDK